VRADDTKLIYGVLCVRFRPSNVVVTGNQGKERMQKKTTELLSVSADGQINHWNASNGKSMHSHLMENNSLTCCDFTRDGRNYVVAGEDKTIYLFDEQTRKLIAGLKEMDLKNDGHKNKIFCVKPLNEDANILVSGGWDRMIKIFDIRAKGPVGSMHGPLICGSDAIDVQGDQILASNHWLSN